MLLNLRPPETETLEVACKDTEGKRHRLALRVRVFNLQEAHWVESQFGKQWFADLLTQNDADGAIQILANQIENREELELIFGEDLLPGLRRNIPYSHTGLVGILQFLAPLWEKAMRQGIKDEKKKTRREQLQRLSRTIFGTQSLFGYCVGAMAAYLWLTFIV